MASIHGSEAAQAQAPTATQLLFARAVILTMELWPVMRLAVAEQWGGPESKDKRDYLVSYLCDTYSSEPTLTAMAEGTTSSSSSTSSSTPALSNKVTPPKAPDMDDLAETLGMYFDDEFESRIEDGSADWVARRIVYLHKTIYAQFPPTRESLASAQSEVDKLAQAAQQLRGTSIAAQKNPDHVQVVGEDEDISESGSESDHAAEDGTGDAMDVDGSQEGGSGQQRNTRSERPEPVIDDEGFTTVVKGRRR